MPYLDRTTHLTLTLTPLNCATQAPRHSTWRVPAAFQVRAAPRYVLRGASWLLPGWSYAHGSRQQQMERGPGLVVRASVTAACGGLRPPAAHPLLRAACCCCCCWVLRRAGRPLLTAACCRWVPRHAGRLLPSVACCCCCCCSVPPLPTAALPPRPLGPRTAWPLVAPRRKNVSALRGVAARYDPSRALSAAPEPAAPPHPPHPPHPPPQPPHQAAQAAQAGATLPPCPREVAARATSVHPSPWQRVRWRRTGARGRDGHGKWRQVVCGTSLIVSCVQAACRRGAWRPGNRPLRAHGRRRRRRRRSRWEWTCRCRVPSTRRGACGRRCPGLARVHSRQTTVRASCRRAARGAAASVQAGTCSSTRARAQSLYVRRGSAARARPSGSRVSCAHTGHPPVRDPHTRAEQTRVRVQSVCGETRENGVWQRGRVVHGGVQPARVTGAAGERRRWRRERAPQVVDGQVARDVGVPQVADHQPRVKVDLPRQLDTEQPQQPLRRSHGPVAKPRIGEGGGETSAAVRHRLVDGWSAQRAVPNSLRRAACLASTGRKRTSVRAAVDRAG
jgi:hypothetical protein